MKDGRLLLDLVHPGSLRSIFLLPFPEKLERFGLDDGILYVWAGAGPGQPSEVPGDLNVTRYIINTLIFS